MSMHFEKTFNFESASPKSKQNKSSNAKNSSSTSTDSGNKSSNSPQKVKEKNIIETFKDDSHMSRNENNYTINSYNSVINSIMSVKNLYLLTTNEENNSQRKKEISVETNGNNYPSETEPSDTFDTSVLFDEILKRAKTIYKEKFFKRKICDTASEEKEENKEEIKNKPMSSSSAFKEYQKNQSTFCLHKNRKVNNLKKLRNFSMNDIIQEEDEDEDESEDEFSTLFCKKITLHTLAKRNRENNAFLREMKNKINACKAKEKSFQNKLNYLTNKQKKEEEGRKYKNQMKEKMEELRKKKEKEEIERKIKVKS
ncbi:MAG: hypothetical protein MJ252_24450, partial [archaeon]|nr:hypothetical protein [archaeon]